MTTLLERHRTQAFRLKLEAEMREQEICEECNHPIVAHGKDGCTVEIDGIGAGGSEGPAPCHCEAWEHEKLEEMRITHYELSTGEL